MSASAIFICGGDDPVAPDTSDCPNSAEHSPTPSGYIAWHEWANRMSRTHKQRRCLSCGLWAIWAPKTKRATPTGPEDHERTSNG